MSEVPAGVEHLKKLAQEYRHMHQSLQEKYLKMASIKSFLAELKQREAALMDRFRLLQHKLLSVVTDEELEMLLDLSRIFDEIRVINQFAIQALVEANEAPEGQRQG